ncbi:flagellar motor switch protein FliN [Thermocrinis sp.]|jgi:flagellar motor switch protein FliN/FliY|uniref:flagellar motor switch protein FliN n=1 Tax=Thermocrinis sp. TaxID=2024383 RepID=UPI00261B30DA|nr:flagellar motor switch protein FliN [Thermocrinis sp.]
MGEEKREEAQAQGEDLSSLWQEALKEQEGKDKEEKREVLTPDIQEKLKKFLDLPLLIEVVVGSTTLTLEEILNLGPGSVVELDNLVEEPVDIKVNGKLVAKGEIVVVEEKFGVKITDIVEKEERVRKAL